MTETFQITLEQAEAYETYLVPAVTGQWADPLLAIAGVGPGDRVLDVACGTGVLARAAAGRTGGDVVGIDLNPAMLEVARRIRPDLAWRQGDAAALPCGDGTFDAVLCQAAVFFFPDVDAALAEMARVVRPGGMVAIHTFAGLDDQPVYGPFIDAVLGQAGADARRLVDTYFSCGDVSALRTALEGAGLRVERTSSPMGVASYASWDALIDAEVRSTPLADRLTDRQLAEIRVEAEELLRGHRTPEGALDVPIRAHLVAARREEV
ncbi:MAG: methyltransferase domain-containing protein [Nocardioides sp.]